jgi:hypothetical protein
MDLSRRTLLTAPAVLCLATPAVAAEAGGDFVLTFDTGRITSLRYRQDRFDTDYIAPGQRLGDVRMTWRRGAGDWQTTETHSQTPVGGDAPQAAIYDLGGGLRLETRFTPPPHGLDWTITVHNQGDDAVEIGDLGLPLPMHTEFKQGQPATAAVLKHSFVSGHGSFVFWMRSNSVGPFLLMTPRADTPLEFWDHRRGKDDAWCAYIHSAHVGEDVAAKGGRWRLPHSSRQLAPGESASYGFTFTWPRDYPAIRDTLAMRGGLDVTIVPGMTLPRDLTADIALRSSATVTAVTAEYPEATEITPLAAKGGLHLYRLQFKRLGENRLAVHQAGGRVTWLEFFVTEPIETLIGKRARFIAGHQVHDASKWYNGLLCEWNMESGVELTPDNYDRIKGWRIYEVTCDDPGLSKPAFLAAKQAEFPVQAEIDAIDAYIEHFVWGGLQRTTTETYPYGIYGIPDWKQNRDSKDPGPKGQLHIWRAYDYSHLIVMYFALYRLARDHPQMTTRLSGPAYLDRAAGTALALFTVPLATGDWSAYETGFYNEIVIPELIETLEAEGRHEAAAALRGHWEKKVRVFVTGAPDLFGSEYAFDSTGFESTQALARYALDHKVDGIAVADASRFSRVQMAANLFCRGVIEPAYYYLGSDYRASAGDAFTLTYMSMMGGGAVLDYGLRDAPQNGQNPHAYLRLGFASCLSAWALINSGDAASNYGYWYPGPANDGGSGGGFEPAAFGETWLGQPSHRGSWYYASESDLGYCGYLRSAACGVADDPLFGRTAYLGALVPDANGIAVIPRDGVRRRLHVVLKAGKLSLALARDRFAAETPIRMTNDLSQIHFEIESDNPAAHETQLALTGDAASSYALDGAKGPEVRLTIPAGPGPHSFSLHRITS